MLIKRINIFHNSSKFDRLFIIAVYISQNMRNVDYIKTRSLNSSLLRRILLVLENHVLHKLVYFAGGGVGRGVQDSEQ